MAFDGPQDDELIGSTHWWQKKKKIEKQRYGKYLSALENAVRSHSVPHFLRENGEAVKDYFEKLEKERSEPPRTILRANNEESSNVLTFNNRATAQEIGDIVRKVRELQGTNKLGLAMAMEITEASVRQLEGGRTNVTFMTLAKYLEALDYEFEVLVKPKSP